jgi:hypothetical protein
MLGLRLANMGAAVLLCALAVLTLGTSPEFTTAVLAIYVFVFAVMLFCFELALQMVAKVIADNMGFFYNAKGRMVFIILYVAARWRFPYRLRADANTCLTMACACSNRIGILCFDLKPAIFGIIMGSLIMLIALVNFYALFRFPEFEEYQRRKHLYVSRFGCAILVLDAADALTILFCSVLLLTAQGSYTATGPTQK